MKKPTSLQRLRLEYKMYNIELTFKQPLTGADVNIIASILRILEENPEFREQHQLFYHENLMINHHQMFNNEEHIVRKPVPYEEFVRLVRAGMEGKLELTVETYDGEVTEEREFFPVTLIEVPHLKKAAIFLNYMPEFIPTPGPEGPEMAFTGELHELFKSDISFNQ